MRTPFQAYTLPPEQLISPSFHFAKFPNPVQNMLGSLRPTDGLNVSELVKFLRV
jgi:hypothetical protein